MVDRLPPLPPSDVDSLDKNAYDSFYKTTPREFWKSQKVVREKVKPDKKCTHEFIPTQNGAQCIKCKYGLIGYIEVREGKLFYKGEQINF